MFGSYLISALRNLFKNPLFSLINIGGLAVGLAVCIMVYLFVQRELNFDDWVKNSDDLYRVEMIMEWTPGRKSYNDSLQVPVQPYIKAKIPEISHAALVSDYFQTFKVEDQVYFERFQQVNPEFLDMFELDYIYGQKDGALADLNSIMLSRSIAEKYFGPGNPIGQVVTVDGNRDMRVTAVYEDIPETSHLSPDALTMFDFNAFPWYSEWSSNGPNIYVKVPDASAMPAIEAGFYNMVAEHKPFMSDDTENPNDRLQYYLQPFKDVHLVSAGRSESNPYGNLAYLYGYIGIAVLILGISCINYVNLSTARATRRTKEVCMRKVMGAGRSDLVRQFMGETVLLSMFALVVAIGLVYALLPTFNKILDVELALDLVGNGSLWVLFVSLVMFSGVMAGIYPAFYVSRFRPSKFLHANKSESGASSRLRNGLVLVQFIVATALIATAGVIYAQMSYAGKVDLGFDRADVMVVRGINRPLTRESSETFLQQVRRIPGVVNAARSYNVPTDGRYSGRSIKLAGTEPEDTPGARVMPSDPDFVETLRVPLIAGRYLSEDLASDKTEIPEGAAEGDYVNANAVLSRNAVEELGLTPEEAIGQTLDSSFDDRTGGRNIRATYTIVGVVEDHTFGSVKRSPDNMMYYYAASYLDTMAIRVQPGTYTDVLAQVEDAWRTLYPDVPPRVQDLEERFDIRVAREKRQGEMFLSFSVIAILLSCLGLLGLAVFTAEHRTKEIGIRKVMGASVANIITLLSWDFSKPVLVANLIALPAAWYFAGRWLEGFSQRIDLNVAYFVGAGLLALFIGWLTVAGHAFRAARANPINALRYE